MRKRLLLDTCVAIWYWSGSERLSDTLIAELRDPENEVVFHQASYLEITIKYSIGKLTLAKPPSELIPEMLRSSQFDYQRLSNRDIAGTEHLEFHHRDPFDRLLISHAIASGAVLVSPDAKFAAYPVSLMGLG